ncbi:MAG TPA: CpsB/CapC family capsule biosynthesis tyrosine phosphatase [Fluviicola sp.]|nr:CpsB/CapC family capsule biosynthesis tyrosine phosphatase [Fluviicola sp.]
MKSNRSLEPVDLSALQVDLHSHLLPGIDDGAKSIDHSLGMLHKFEELGYRKVITTPHVMNGVYNNTTAGILAKRDELRGAAKAAGLSIEIEASAEYYFDETLFERVKSGDLLPFHQNCILFECSFRNEPTQLEDLVFDLISSGYQPIIAHFERYMYYHGSTKMARRLRELGVWIQVNNNSLTGHYGPEVKKQALQLIKEGLVDIAGTDCHRIEHLHILEKHLSDQAFHQLLALPLRNKDL